MSGHDLFFPLAFPAHQMWPWPYQKTRKIFEVFALLMCSDWLLVLISGMGTKLQYMINVLATSPNNSRLTEKPMEDWDYFKNKELKVDFKRTCIDKLHNSMDRILEQNNVETIKKTMLMHEDLFKHQVILCLDLHKNSCTNEILSTFINPKNSEKYCAGEGASQAVQCPKDADERSKRWDKADKGMEP